MDKDKHYLEKRFEELKDNRLKDTTNLMRVQIDLFLNILKEAGWRWQAEPYYDDFIQSIVALEKNVPLLERFFLHPPCWAVAESEDQLCRVSFIRNKIMKSGINPAWNN